METPTRRPIFLGAAASTAAAPTAFFAYSIYPSIGQTSVELFDLAVGGVFIYFYGTLISGPISVAIGLPYALWLKRRGQLTWLALCLGATFTGLLAFIAIWFFAYQLYSPIYWFAVVGAISGLVSGIAFCAVVQPNPAFKPTPSARLN